MSDLEDKLAAIEFAQHNGEDGKPVPRTHLSSAEIEMVKQAFQDAGWKDVPTILESLDKSSVTFRAEEPNDVLMTGQEWFDRYQAEIEKMNEGTDFKAELARIKESYPGFKAHEAAVLYTASKLEEAAKRASGLEGKASPSTDQGQESPVDNEA